MDVKTHTILEYITATGNNPFREWLHALKDITARAIIRTRLNRVRLGNFGDCKTIGVGLHELRVPHGPGYRVYFGRIRKTTVLLLCGGDKKTQGKDIQKAHEYWYDYQRRTS